MPLAYPWPHERKSAHDRRPIALANAASKAFPKEVKSVAAFSLGIFLPARARHAHRALAAAFY
jgi:hypothetical protein